ncbi:GTP-dependent dephospho-CoA kinase family protein [Halobacteria archaeon AArc-dxtr1]|nr:GTP-dependent dephospho-CoA kinase family protein [Halobacteria archaeon AArc-dxtr1]
MPDDDDTPSDSRFESAEPTLRLPVDLRADLKEPMGPVETDAEAVLARVEGPLIAVGDVVTYHFLQAGVTPDVALVDGRTERSAVDDAVERVVTDGVSREVDNPPGVITASLVRAIRDALAADEPTTIFVDGEEDLAALPAIVLASEGATVVYGQPGEGMVHVRVDDAARDSVRTLLGRFERADEPGAVIASLLDR